MLSIHSCPLGQLGSRDTGGMNVYVRELSRQLGLLGHEVDIFTRAHDPRDAQMEKPFQNVRLIHIRAGRVEDMGKMAQLSHLAEFTQNMAEFTSAGPRYDILHSHYWLSGLVGRQFGEAWGIPQIVMFHTLGAIKNSLPVGEPEPDVRLRAESSIVRDSRRLVAATENEKTQLSHFYDAPLERVSVIPCGVNLEIFHPVDKFIAREALGLGKFDEIVLSVGRIEPLKGLDRLIEACSLINRPNLKLLIIGGDEYSRVEVDRLKGLSVELGIGDRITFPGTIKQDRLSLYYSTADVSVVSSYYESFCLIILESLACGTPVVSTDVGVAPLVIKGANGLVVSCNEATTLARGVERVILERRAFTPDLVRSSVETYGWPYIGRRISELYDSALFPNPVPQGQIRS